MKDSSNRSIFIGVRVRGAAVIGLLALVIGACASTAADSPTVPATTTPVGEANVDQPPLQPAGDSIEASVPANVETQSAVDETMLLTQDEIDGLLLMREEEKLAHDVYETLYDLWGLRIFTNIARAETTHMEAVGEALDRYNLDDPVEGNALGVFTDTQLQSLYDELVERGSESLVAALEVGALIEDLDIVDLQSLATDVPDLAQIYANLEKGSRNHLRAFVSNLEQRGESYTPVHLTQEAFEAIVAGSTETGPTG